jgi:hypothetical protein
MQALEISQSRASRGLTALYDAGFLKMRKDGLWSLYSIDKEAIQVYQSQLLEAVKEALKNNLLVNFVMRESLADVFCPAAKLWNTGYGATMMREAVSLMGGYGITEDCPGFLGQKWMDAQLEATYEGPEAVQRRQLALDVGGQARRELCGLAHVHRELVAVERVASHHVADGGDLLALAQTRGQVRGVLASNGLEVPDVLLFSGALRGLLDRAVGPGAAHGAHGARVRLLGAD